MTGTSANAQVTTASQQHVIDQITGTAIPLRGANIDTDRIIPARFLKAVTFQGLEGHVFEDDRRADTGHPFDDPRFKGASILLVNDNFGSGSSREHAPQAIKRWGIAACVGESFSEIFRGNALAIGLPCATLPPSGIEQAMRTVERTPSTPVTVSIRDRTVRIGQTVFDLELPAATREALLKGRWDPTTMLLDNFDQVRTVAQTLPYVKGF